MFVGFGGVERRDAVRNVAPVYLNGESMAPLVVMAAGMDGVNHVVGLRILSTAPW